MRPRSARAHDQVLQAAMGLFAARGVDTTSMDAIADESGVSKATIYKHWPDKDALCADVMSQLHGHHFAPPVFESDDVRADMVALLNYQPPLSVAMPEHAELRVRIMPHFMAYAARNPAFAKRWRAHVLEPPRAQLTRLLERAIAQKLLPPTLDIDLSIALLLGPMMYRHVLRLISSEAPERMAQRVVDAFWKAHALPQPATLPKAPVRRSRKRR